MNPNLFDLDDKVGEWRQYLRQHAALSNDDQEELEGHLRDHINALIDKGLHADEAFLIATKRVGQLHQVSQQYAQVHSVRLWRHLVFGGTEYEQGASLFARYRELMTALIFAVLAAVMLKLPTFVGYEFGTVAGEDFYIRNALLLVFPAIAGFFVWQRQLGTAGFATLAVTWGIGMLLLNGYPFSVTATEVSATLILTIIHLPIVLWFVVGVLYTGDFWRSPARRMDFIRFSGEFVIYYVLIALGGGVLTATMIGLFSLLGIDMEVFAQTWLIPCGAAGAVVISAFLVELKQSAIENMAPVLARIFAPLVTLLLLGFLVTLVATGFTLQVDREVLIALDLMLVLVLGLVLYSVSSRDTQAPVGLFDRLICVLIVVALLVNMFALFAIGDRILAQGLTPNRVAALGENLVLLVSLMGYAWYYTQFVRGRTGYAAIERWQTAYIPIYALWALVVVVLLPPVFGFN